MNLSRTALIAAAVTGMLPAGVEAAALNQNLVANPSFENLAGRDALDWAGNVSTYLYSQNYTGPAPAGGGLAYWNGAFGAGNPAQPLASQLLDLTGNAGQIDAGLLRYNLSAFFTTYYNQLDYGTVRAIFFDATSTAIGSASIGGAEFVAGLGADATGLRTWGQDAFSGAIPSGTRMVRLELQGDKEPGVGAVADGYIDLVNFQIVPEPSTWTLLGVSLLAGGWRVWRRRG